MIAEERSFDFVRLLPADVSLEILRRLPWNFCLAHAVCVSRNWRDLILSDAGVKIICASVDAQYIPSSTPDWEPKLRKLLSRVGSSLHSLRFQWPFGATSLSQETFDVMIKSCTGLTYLSTASPIPGHVLLALTSLRSLDLELTHGMEFSSDEAVFPEGLDTLVMPVLSVLGSTPLPKKLKELRTKISADGLGLRNLPQSLEKLCISHSTFIQEAVVTELIHLTRLKNLKCLDVRNCRIDDETLAGLLRKLPLVVEIMAGALTSRDVLPGMMTWQECMIRPTLRCAILPQITLEEDRDYVAKTISSLTALDLSKSKVSLNTLRQFLPSLQKLWLRQAPVACKLLEGNVYAPRLRSLDLSGNPLTDTHLLAIAKTFPNLRVLILHSCLLVTAPAANQLMTTMPTLQYIGLQEVQGGVIRRDEGVNVEDDLNGDEF
mmetsp:Transcript_17855/g.29567  ORF Transcript_17855/g.29567 Transcript_17855/m.29567 type:complete len:434 (-) Transcript_17855:451-1752(-)